MFKLNPNHKSIDQYYIELEVFDRLGVKHEMAVKTAFQHILEYCCQQVNWTFIQEYKKKGTAGRLISLDGGLVDNLKIPHAYWEAKDSQDDLVKEVDKKFIAGYPKDNIIFQSPIRAILWQDGIRIYDVDITKRESLVDVVRSLFTYKSDVQSDWEQAVEDFKPRIPEVAIAAVKLIEDVRKTNPEFVKVFDNFASICRSSINPNLSDAAIEEMLVQHLLTERIFLKVFNNSDFTNRNIIAHEIDKVISCLTSRVRSKEDFLKPLYHFYGALERRAETLDDYSQKQTFINTVYERFFQGFAVKQADTYGIVYTPQPIVDFMVRSVEEILKKEFIGKSLSDKDVQIIDPFVGTGTFITRIMREIKKTSLQYKYENDLHCNEVMLLPYYIASTNIENEYLESTGEYKSFEGICLVDTFELAEDKQLSLMFEEKNTERVDKLRRTKLFVIIGNPPYNSKQVNENDNNKNRKYKTIDKRIAETYSADSKATLRSKSSDPYVKAIRWATDKVLENGEGLVAFVSNNSFLDDIAFDGMRKNLLQDFNKIYIVDLGGNVRKDPKLSGTVNSVFGIQVGVSINLFIKKKEMGDSEIFYAETGFRATKTEKFCFLDSAGSINGIQFRHLLPNYNYTWLVEGLDNDFDSLLPMGTTNIRPVNTPSLFTLYSLGVSTNRDAWVYNFDYNTLCQNVKLTLETYNQQLSTWQRLVTKPRIDDFVSQDSSKISWSERLKQLLQRYESMTFNSEKIRQTCYRPFEKTLLYFDTFLIDRPAAMPRIFPQSTPEGENLAICVGMYGRKLFSVIMVSYIPNLNFFGDPQQSFPFYTYNENGTDRRENITDWAVEQFSSAIGIAVDKWQIFHYIYGLLHCPQYRENYQANLKREIPRIPPPKTIEQFNMFVSAGERLADLHINYESQKEYLLKIVETPDKKLNWNVKKMKLTKDKTAIVYNEFLTLKGIPPEVFNYKLGNRSALEWIIDRYQKTTDKRSHIKNDPNRTDVEQYIVRLIGKIITVSIETMKIVAELKMPPI